MMLQKALKMDAPEAFSDFLTDFHLMGNKVETIHMDPDNWNKVGVLTMVMHPHTSGLVGSTVPGSSTKVYHGPFVQPTAFASGPPPGDSLFGHYATYPGHVPNPGAKSSSVSTQANSQQLQAPPPLPPPPSAAPATATAPVASTSSGARSSSI